ncbi:MAG: RraA family protein [Actinomycetota bacterium]|nr:RraA family protein [Actinomycetota bacterium]
MPDESLRPLRDLDVSSLADADKGLRVMTGLARVNPGAVMVGRAHTVRCTTDLFAVLDALELARPGEVLVVETQGSPSAVAGELIATEAHRKGLAGIVVDGVCRDVAGLRRLPLPFYARGTRPDAGGVAALGQRQVPVRCAGVEVRPGEVLFGDDDGVLVASDDEVQRALPQAREIQRREQEVLEHMRRGGSLFDRLDLSPVRDGTGPATWLAP